MSADAPVPPAPAETPRPALPDEPAAVTPKIRRLHPLSWLFMTATSLKGLVLPAVLVLFASARSPLARYELLSLLLVGPALVAALLKQGIYNYRFTDEELVIREGILVKKERHIPYDRVHNVALVRNPVHRLLGVASTRVETASGGKAEAVMRVLSLEAVDELRRYTLGKERAAALAAVERRTAAAPSSAASVAGGSVAAATAAVNSAEGAVGGPAVGSADTAALPAAPAGAATEARVADAGVLLHVPVGELVRLGLISNRGFIVVAAALGLVSQANWWEQDWEAYFNGARETAPDWFRWLGAPGSLASVALLVVAAVLVFVLLLRIFSVGWYLVKYYDFTLAREDDDLRTEFGLLTRISSLVPVRRIQLMTVSASFLHRCFDRAGIGMETAGTQESGDSELGDDLAASGLKTSRQWLAPVISGAGATALIRRIMPDVDLAAVSWQPIAGRARARLVKKGVIAAALLTGGVMALLSLTSVAGSGWQALWLPAALLPLTWFGVTGWVRNAGWAVTDSAVFFRSGWLGRQTSVVRLDKMQTVALKQSPFDRRHRMASVAVDTAGAGQIGHRIDIPYLDLEVAQNVFDRLYAHARATEFSW
jgi:putative membrane protein